MSDQKKSLKLPVILIGVNLFAFANPESSHFKDSLFYLLDGLRKAFNNYDCDIYTINNNESDLPFSINIYRANIYGEAVAYVNGKINYPLLEAKILSFLNELIFEITLKIEKNSLPNLRDIQYQALDHSIEHARRILTAERDSESLNTAIENEDRYFNKEAFYMKLENEIELYCMDYTGEIKLQFAANEQIHVIKDTLSLIYELRIKSLTSIENLPQLTSDDFNESEVQEIVDKISATNNPKLYELYSLYLSKISQLTNNLKTPEKFIRIAMKDGFLLHSILHSL